MEVVVGTRDMQFVEEDLRHVVVIVLSGVDDDFLDLVCIMVADGAAQCSSFDDLGTCPDDGEEFHGRFGFSEGHVPMVEETVVAFVAYDDMVFHCDVK